MADIQVITQDFVNVHITKSDSEDAPPIERRFKKEITVSDFKVNDSHILLCSNILLLNLSLNMVSHRIRVVNL